MDTLNKLLADTLEELPAHQQVLKQAVEQFRADGRVAGILIGGSVGNTNLGVDFYSDIDLNIITDSEDLDAVFADRDTFAEEIGDPLFQYAPLHGYEHQYSVLYRELVKVDFVYRRTSELSPKWKWRHCRILKDTDGSLRELVDDSKECSPTRLSAEQLKSLNQRFWTYCWDTFGKIERGELWMAAFELHNIRSEVLLPFVSWVSGVVDHGYRRLESKMAHEMDDEFAEMLKSTAVSRDPEALHTALKTAIELYCTLREEVFEYRAVGYDTEPERVVRDEMRKRRS
jgi:hypothetical protein